MTYEESRTLEKLTALNHIRQVFKPNTRHYYNHLGDQRADDIKCILYDLDKKLQELKQKNNEKQSRKTQVVRK